MGIEQLVDTFKGNPAPLNAKVQRDNKGQPPGAVPKDLEEALALQKIAEIQRGAQNQQAIQAGGAQPSVVEKLRQMLGAMQAQSQPTQMPGAMPARPVMAARGGSIDQLTSNLGRHYAGGGIIAFTEGGRGEDKDPDLIDRYGAVPKLAAEIGVPVWAYKQAADFLARTGTNATVGEVAMALAREGVKGAASSAYNLGKTAVSGPGMAVMAGGIPATQFTADVMRGNPKLREAYTDNYMLGAMDPDNALGAAILSQSEGKKAVAQKQREAADTSPETEKLRRLAAAQGQTGQNTNPALRPNQAAAPAAPRPNAGLPGAAGTGGAARPEALDPNSLRGLLEANIRKEMGIDSDVERDKAVDWTRKTLGLDALLGEKEKRANAREALMKQAQASRTPEWVKGLQAASGPAVRGGIGMLLGQVGKGATAAREAYMAQDLEYAQELDRLRDVITDAKIKGNQEMVREGMAAYKEVDARRRAAANNAATLVQVDEQTRSREQIAKDNAASRAQIAAAQIEDKKAKRLQDQKNFLAQEERKWQDTLNRNPDYKKLVDARALQERLLYMSTDPKVQEKAQEAVDMYNEKIQKMIPTAGGGTVNIPPPPKGAVTRVG